MASALGAVDMYIMLTDIQIDVSNSNMQAAGTRSQSCLEVSVQCRISVVRWSLR